MRRNTIFISVAIITLGACSPRESDVEQAVKTHWPREQAAARQDAAFYSDHAKSFEEGAAMSRRISAKFGKANDVGSRHAEVAKEDRLKEQNALWLSKSNVKSVKNVRCQKASEVSGHYCEMDIELKGADGAIEVIGGAWRFDTVGGELAIVG